MTLGEYKLEDICQGNEYPQKRESVEVSGLRHHSTQVFANQGGVTTVTASFSNRG